MPSSRNIFLGLMSGTSVDGIDAVAIDLADNSIAHNERILGHCSLSIPSDIKSRVIALSSEATDSLSENLELDFLLGHLFADCVLELINKLELKASDIQAIGSHGQTIRHKPPLAGSTQNQSSYSQQIGDANIIAERTGVEVVADFRSRDIAAGGQAAPLLPAFHAHWFGEFEQRKVAVNIGGMANISVLESDRCTAGFDSGPGNALMDYWCEKNTGAPIDLSGEWAVQGNADKALLDQLLSDPYFQLPAPKSTGRERFNAQWLEQKITDDIAPQDVQTTLLELTAQSICAAIKLYAPVCGEVILCGGGVHNTTLYRRIQELAKTKVTSCVSYGLQPEQVEAAAFAWLAKKRLENEVGNSPAVTGALGYRVLGAIYSA
jgi:anhydro-N-acetylmuramic acid kinase